MIIAVVILRLRVLARTSRGNGNKLFSVRGFIILGPGDGLSSFSKDNSVNFFFGEKEAQ